MRDIGSIHGYAIELGEPIDGTCGPDGGRTGAEQIAADPQIIGVIGTSCSGAAVAASPVLSEAGLVMVSPSNTSPRLTSDLAGNPGPDYHPGYYRVDDNDLYQGQAVADFAYRELGLRRMATVDDGDPYTTALVSAFGDAFRALARWKLLRQRRRSSNLPGPSPFFTQGEDDMKKWIGISLAVAAVAVGLFYGLVYAALRSSASSAEPLDHPARQVPARYGVAARKVRR